MKINAAVIGANLAGFALLAVAYLLERSSCLGLPDWAIPVLATVQILINAVAPPAWKKEI